MPLKDVFVPPIRSRTTDELLEIVGAPQKWNDETVKLAKYELSDRRVPMMAIEAAKQLVKEDDKIEKENKATEGYTVWDFIFRLKSTLFIIMFSWELKRDGYHRKAEQQKVIRTVIIVLLLICFALSYLT